MKTYAAAVPVLSILLTALLAALPWGFGGEYRFLMPHLVYLVIHFWALRHPSRVPEWAPFAAGLGLDVLTGGPLGFWALVFLAGYALAVLQAPWAEGGKLVRWLLFAGGVVAISVLEWSLASLYFLERADWRPFATSAVSMILAYPPVALVLAGLVAAPEPDIELRLERRR